MGNSLCVCKKTKVLPQAKALVRQKKNPLTVYHEVHTVLKADRNLTRHSVDQINQEEPPALVKIDVRSTTGKLRPRRGPCIRPVQLVPVGQSRRMLKPGQESPANPTPTVMAVPQQQGKYSVNTYSLKRPLL